MSSVLAAAEIEEMGRRKKVGRKIYQWDYFCVLKISYMFETINAVSNWLSGIVEGGWP